MAKSYSGENTLTYLVTLIKNALAGKLDKTDVVNNLTSTDTEKVLSAAQGKILADQIAAAGGGDMLKSVYDTDNDGVVDNAQKLEGHPASDFATPESVSQAISAQKGQANGLAPLGADKKINSEYLPSYVDDVVEGYYHDGFFYEDEGHVDLMTGESGKIYVDLASNTSYRWTGSAYIAISSGDMVEISNTKVQEIWDAAV